MNERRFNPANAARLDNPERRKALPPEKLLELLNVRETDTVVDLGTGTGYFTLPAAQLTSNMIYAVDAEPQMLQILQKRLQEQNVDHVKLMEGAIESIPLPDETADAVIASFVLHEVSPLEQGLSEIHRIMKEGGGILCIEWEKKAMEQGPPLHHRLHSDELKEQMEQAGFRDIQITKPTEAHYVVTAKK